MNNFKAKQLKNLIAQKNSKLCLSLDVPEWDKFFYILDEVGEKLVLLKVHLDIMENIHYDNLKQLFDMKKKYNFLIWEDRKLCDIGHTNLLVVKKLLSYQFYDEFNRNIKQTEYHSQKLIDYISILPIGGELSITPLLQLDIGIFLLAEMSSKDNFFNDIITNNILHLSNKYKNNVVGIINQKIDPFIIKYPMLSITPGISIGKQTTKDGMGQQYRNITDIKTYTDIFVIGRAIYQSDNPSQMVNDICEELSN
jgi:orotidine 5'-phosphate decarboxylase subfamily 1